MALMHSNKQIQFLFKIIIIGLLLSLSNGCSSKPYVSLYSIEEQKKINDNEQMRLEELHFAVSAFTEIYQVDESLSPESIATTVIHDSHEYFEIYMKALQKKITLRFYHYYIKEPRYDSNEELLQKAKDEANTVRRRTKRREFVKKRLRDSIITQVVKYRTYKKMNK